MMDAIEELANSGKVESLDMKLASALYAHCNTGELGRKAKRRKGERLKNLGRLARSKIDAAGIV